jgi:hypothetical protein
MLADLQQAMADLVASADRVAAARADPQAWLAGYRLSPPEQRRLAGFLAQPGLALGCMVYRANRLAPVAMHLTDLCRAVGPGLRAVMDEFWAAHPHAQANPLLECARFCDFLAVRLDLPAAADAELPQARAAIAAALAASGAVSRATAARPPAPPSAPSSPSDSAAPALPAHRPSPPPRPAA